MSQRRNFTKAVKVEIVRRATRDGQTYCEKCAGLAKRFDIDHRDPDALQIDKTRKLTAADGQLICSGAGSCHEAKTKADVAAIATAKRREASHLGVRTRPVAPLKSAPFPRSIRTAGREPKPALPPRTIYEEA